MLFGISIIGIEGLCHNCRLVVRLKPDQPDMTVFLWSCLILECVQQHCMEYWTSDRPPVPHVLGEVPVE